MKKAYLKELRAKLLGSVTDNAEALDYFSTDLSIFRVRPAAVVYPANTADVRKTVQFAAGQTAAGRPLSLTPRGHGTDMGGGAVGEGLQLVFPAHMDKLLRLDGDSVTVQPGISYQTLQQTLHTHGRFLPPYPAGLGSTSIGGAVANDDSGQKSVKYGATRDFVKKLKVVLSDGSLIETHRISGRELNRKKGLMTLEGEIYRALDSLLLDNAGLIRKQELKTLRNTAGYALGRVRGKGGSFDLSQAIIGSQGTLGIITEITLKTAPYSPRTTLVVGYCDAAEPAMAAVTRLRALGPSGLEMVDGHLLGHVADDHGDEMAGLLPGQPPKIVLFVEFDDVSQFAQKLKTGRAQRILTRHGATVRTATDPVEQVALWKLRRLAAAATWMRPGARKALPFLGDSAVPLDHLPQFLDKTYKLLDKHDLEIAVWGHVGDGNLQLQPLLDLTKKKDVDKLFTLNREFNHLVISLGGTPSGGSGEGLLRAAGLRDLYGAELTKLFADTKHIFDPQDILNPRLKTGATEDFARAHLRDDYSLKHYEHVTYT